MKKPSVTELIDQLNKPALLKWANKIGLQGISLDQHRASLKSEGVNVHKLIEDDLKGIKEYDNTLFHQFKSKYRVVSVEPVISCEHYTGRGDVLLEKDGKLFLFDFKHSDKIYFEQILQLVGYKRALKADEIGIVHTGTFTESIININQTQEREYLNILGALVIIYNSKNRI